MGKQSETFASIGDAGAASAADGALLFGDLFSVETAVGGLSMGKQSGLSNTTTGEENGESAHASSSTSIMDTS
jgi:hypothetical protein|tara:strand:+ start:957 stop:1175 length:219 start_codon:yes stop_codon:yes gene_type:complete